MSSVLETFYLLFQSNSQEVKKGVDEATLATNTFEQGVAHMDAAVIASGEQILELFGRVAIRIASAFAIEEVASFIGEVSELNAQLGITATRLGIDVGDLDAYQQAAQRAGGSTEGFTQTLDFLNRGMADIATKGTSRLKPFFDELKIKVTDAPHHVRPLLDILGDLADKLSKMGAQQRAGISEKLGIDTGTVLLLAQGRRGMEDLVARQKELGVATDANAEEAHRYRQAMEDLGQQFRHIATEIGSSVLPGLENFFRAIGRVITYLSEHKGLVEGFFIGVAGVIGTVYLPTVIEAAAATWALLAPILAVVGPIVAVGAAIAFLVDDVQAFLAGNKSAIGELSKSWPEIGETVRAVVKGMGEAMEWFGDLFSNGAKLVVSTVTLLSSIFSALGGAVGNLAHEIVKSWVEAFPVLVPIFKGIGDAIAWVVGLIEKLVGAFARLAGAAVTVLPKALGNWSKSADRLTGVVQGKETYAHYQADERHQLEARLAPHQPRQVAILKPAQAQHPAPGPWVNQLPKSLAEGIQKAQVSISTADRSPLSAAHSVTTKNEGDRIYNFKVENLTVQTQAKDADGISHEINGHLEKHWRQAINQFDDGVKG